MKTLGYIRVSTKDQKDSIIVQENKIREYCRFKNIHLNQIITDEDISGGTPFRERPGGSQIFNSLSAGDTLISIKPDRLFRNVQDALLTVDHWDHHNISLHIIDLGGNSIDTKTAMGRLFFTQAISMAEFERRITGERTKAILNNRKDSSKVYCNQIFGFDKIEGQLTPNQSEMQIIQKIKLWSSHMNPNQIASELNRLSYTTKTGKPFLPSTIRYILKNPIYSSFVSP